jgi:hypothetical protein
MSNALKWLPQFYNYVEVALWPALGAMAAIAGWRRPRGRRAFFFAAAGVLVVFGASDWFEAETGNEWWHPWWLLLWKAACVGALLVILVLGWRRGRGVGVVG